MRRRIFSRRGNHSETEGAKRKVTDTLEKEYKSKRKKNVNVEIFPKFDKEGKVKSRVNQTQICNIHYTSNFEKSNIIFFNDSWKGEKQKSLISVEIRILLRMV